MEYRSHSRGYGDDIRENDTFQWRPQIDVYSILRRRRSDLSFYYKQQHFIFFKICKKFTFVIPFISFASIAEAIAYLDLHTRCVVGCPDGANPYLDSYTRVVLWCPDGANPYLDLHTRGVLCGYTGSA